MLPILLCSNPPDYLVVLERLRSSIGGCGNRTGGLLPEQFVDRLLFCSISDENMNWVVSSIGKREKKKKLTSISHFESDCTSTLLTQEEKK